ncbi:MAG: sigma-70 family RNA polymerase sigma factor [Clostridia bacterium]|nr:sigma-70 family RNA polymerase sigma factor [Clostridia bacterium]
MRSESEVIKAIDKYADTVTRICMLYLKSYTDTEDVFQSVFIKYAFKSPEFENETHEKAWIIRVTINACKDMLKSFFRNRTVPLAEAAKKPWEDKEDLSYVLEAVLSLPEKYRVVVYLHYFEEYTAVEIGQILKKNVNTIYTRLARAKEMLRERLGGDGYEG